jgi:hypothetical protein
VRGSVGVEAFIIVGLGCFAPAHVGVVLAPHREHRRVIWVGGTRGGRQGW